MKIVELLNYTSLMLTNEEADVLVQFEHTPKMTKKELSEREVYIANQLVNKEVLERRNNDGTIEYTKKIR